MQKFSAFVLSLGLIVLSGAAIAEPLTIGSDDDIDAVLAAYNGKRVTVKLDSGDELTGKLAHVSDDLVVLQELSGKEFFDAAIKINDIAAVVVRARDR